MKTKLYFSIIMLSLFFPVCEKVNAQAPTWQWAIGIGWIGNDPARSIALDGANNIYTTGEFYGTVDFDPGFGTYILSAAGINDAFIFKTNSSGNFLWAKAIGGGQGTFSYSIAVDDSGNVYITGYFWGTSDFDPGPGIFNMTSTGNFDVYILKLDHLGNFVWAKQMTGTTDDYSFSIALDGSGNVYTTGYFSGTVDFDPGTGVFNLYSAGNNDIFISKLDNSGNFIWAKLFGGSGYEGGNTLAYDTSINIIYVTGYFNSPNILFDSTNVVNASVNTNDIFIASLDSSGNIVWAKSCGGADADVGGSITFDAYGNIYVTGFFAGTADFDPDSGIFNLTSAGSSDIFVSKLDGSGNFLWAKSMGGVGLDHGVVSIIDNSDNIFTTGYFNGTGDFNPGSGVFNLTSAGNTDIFISKLDSSGNFIWAKETGGLGSDVGASLALTNSSDLYLAGTYQDTISFDNTTLINGTNGDFFIAKLTSCSAYFSVYPDTIPHNWFALNMASGVPPLTYLWSWGDGNTSTGATPSHTYSTPGFYNICLTINDANGCSSTYCDSSTYIYKGNNTNSIITINVVMSLPNGIENIDGNSQVTLFPNPATNHLTITLPGISNKVTLTITDITGKIIYNITDASTQKIEVNTKDFTSGIYFVQIQTPAFVETKKLVVAK